MKYADIRDQIRDGDLIAVRSKHSGLPALTRFFTRSPYTHTAVAIWLGGGLWAAEMNAGGNVLVPVSRWENTDFDVFTCPVDRTDVCVAILETLRGKIDYDLVDLLRIAAHNVLRCKLPTDTGGLVCSAYSAKIYTLCGWRPLFLSSIPAPSDLVAAMPDYPLFEVRA
jgi:hypothetical protein